MKVSDLAKLKVVEYIIDKESEEHLFGIEGL